MTTVGLRSVINGSGQDTSAFVLNWIRQRNTLYLATLYLLGDPEDPNAFWMTDWDSPLLWSWWGRFYPAVIKRGSVKSQVGLSVDQFKLSWTPTSFNAATSFGSGDAYFQVWAGLLDGANLRSWTAYMPTPGDCDTLGCSELFGGRVGNVQIDQGVIELTINSYLDVVNQMVPGAVIESTDSVAGYKGAVPPAGSSIIPVLTVVSGGNTQITASGGTFAVNDFVDGFIYFITGDLEGTSATVYGSAATDVHGNTTIDVGPLPNVPSPGDTFYISASAGNLVGVSGQYPFPYVPAPEQAV